MPELLSTINEPNDIKKIEPSQYPLLAKEIRRFLVSHVSKTGGHLSSNLGVVELTMALHLFLDLPKDKLIWDVGHQSYTHKLLTGRRNDFATLRQYEGMSGFPKHAESACDCFDTGHSSTSISIADGFVKARDLCGQDYKVVAVIGDGALSGGMAFEALNNAGRFKSNMIIVLNDNNMSISENVGGMARYLGKIRTNKGYKGFKNNLEKLLNAVPVAGPKAVRKLKRSKDSIKQLLVAGMLFENMGITYIGPIDGHNINHMLTAFESASRSTTPVLVHVVTKKGKGYRAAENDPAKYHGVEPFDAKTGEVKNHKSGKSYTDIFSETILRLGEENKKIVAVSAAMADGTGLAAFAEAYPKRFFDVGIAEEHAVTFAAGLASAGLRPVVAIYSTFLQRAYDQIIHDVCMSSLPVVFAVDRAGIVGNDGETHQGIFDLSYLTSIPGLTVMAPKDGEEFEKMLEFAFELEKPVAIRYPRGCVCSDFKGNCKEITYGKAEIVHEGFSAVTLMAVGNMTGVAEAAAKMLMRDHDIDATVVNARFAAPFDKEMVLEQANEAKLFVTLEENVRRGGFGEAVADFLLTQADYKRKFLNISLPDNFIPHGDAQLLRNVNKIDVENVVQRIYEKWLTNKKYML